MLWHYRPCLPAWFAEVDYSLDAIERRMVVDPCEQYDRPIDVPHKRGKVSLSYAVSHCPLNHHSRKPTLTLTSTIRSTWAVCCLLYCYALLRLWCGFH